MKPNPLACALLVLLAIAVQLPAQNTNTASVPSWADTQPVTSSGTNAAGAAAPKKQTAEEFLDAPNTAGTNSSDWEPVSSSGTNAAATNKEIDFVPDTNSPAGQASSTNATENPNALMATQEPTLSDGSKLKVFFYNRDWSLFCVSETNDSYSEVIARAEKGDPTAQVLLGFHLIESDVLTYVQGADKLIQRADAGGTNATEKAAEAVKWFRKAADQGRADADNDLGVCYANGLGVPQDKTEAEKWYNKSVIDKFKETKALAEQGNATAQYDVGFDYLFGNPGAPKSIVEAAKWLGMAGEQGNTNAQQWLVNMYIWDNPFFGTTKDSDKAIYWLRKFVGRTGDAEAENNLGAALDEKQNYVEAVNWFRKAAEQGNADGQSNLGLMYHKGQGVETDDTEAVRWFQKAAEQGDDTAQFYLGLLYDDGKGVPQDYAEALKWYSRAAAQGDDTAQYNLALMYDKGEGAPQDFTEAYKWYNLAAAQGDTNAIHNRNIIVRHMAPEQIAEAQRLSREFKPRKESGSDNSPTPDSPTASGTGFFITDDGYLISNYHVVKDASRVRVVTSSGTVPAKVVQVDEANDIALLKADGQFAVLPVASSRTVKLGGTVATVGFPDPGLQGFSPKLAKGEIAALAGAGDNARYFQISVPVQPGNSGGALVDERGNVVGIVSAKLDASVALAASGALPENVNYAVKSSFLLGFLESVPEVSAKLKEPNTQDEKFEDVVKSAQQAAVLVLVY